MEITNYGSGCIYVATKNVNILIDPPSGGSKNTIPKVKSDVTLLTMLDTAATIKDNDFIIDCPGEYETKGVSVQGIAAGLHIDKPEDPLKSVMYVVSAADVRLLFTGNIQPSLSDEQVDVIGEVNVMVIPVGGHGLTLDAKGAAGLISRFEPQYVIPIHYDDGNSIYEMPQDKLDTFLKEIGVESPKPEAKLKVVAKELGEQTQIKVLEVGK